MSSDDSSGSRPAAPIVLRLKLRYDDVEVMVQQFASNVGKSGLFLPTRSLQPIGAEIKFEIRLANDEPAIIGLGRVRSAKPPDPLRPKAAFGMGIELMRVTPQSRALILRMLEQRRAAGLPEIGLPTADDLDAARRTEASPAPRGAASGPIHVPASGPLAVPASGPLAAPPRVDAHAGEALLTAPRRASGPIAIAKVLAVAPLPPEPARRKRLAVSEVIESASGPVARVSVAVPGIDDDVDLAAALSRARRLAGDALDAELQALCEVAAAPLEISIEAASAELARQLGGSAVRRDRSARWTPPAIPVATPVAPAAADPAAADPAAVDPAAVDPAAVDPAAARLEADAVPRPISDASAPDAEADAPSDEVDAPDAEADAPSDEADASSAVAAVPPADAVTSPTEAAPSGELAPALARRITAEHEVAPEQIADEVHQLHDQDLEDVERTELGDIPVPVSTFDYSFATEPSLADQLALGDRERDADPVTFSGEPPRDVSLEEVDDFEILAEADADDEDLLAAHGEQEASSGGRAAIGPSPSGRPSSELDFAARLDFGEDSDVYYNSPEGEFSTRHVLDRVPDELADDFEEPELPTAHLVSARRAPPTAQPALPTAHLASAQQALAMFEADEPLGDGDAVRISQPIFEAEPEPEPSNTFTLTDGRLEPADLGLELPHRQPTGRTASAQRPEPVIASRTRSRPVVYKEPAILHNRPSFPSLLDSPVEDYELEHALEALDVDLDDLSIPHAATQLQRDVDPAKSRPTATIRPGPQTHNPPSQPRTPAATPSRPVAPRLTTDEGVLIDFDDDE